MKTILLITAMAALALSAAAQSWSVTSPNGLVKLTVQLANREARAGYPDGPALYYRVEQGAEGNREIVINDSPLGLALQRQQFVTALRFDSAQPVRFIEEAYATTHGKRRQCLNSAKHLTLAFRNSAEQPLELDLRAYDDGVAFRYRLPGSDSKIQTLEAELTSFALPSDAKLWMAPSDKATTYSPAYETYYEKEIAVGTPSPNSEGWSFPVLFRSADSNRWALITEANVGPNFCAARLANTAPNGVYRISLPDPKEGND